MNGLNSCSFLDLCWPDTWALPGVYRLVPDISLNPGHILLALIVVSVQTGTKSRLWWATSLDQQNSDENKPKKGQRKVIKRKNTDPAKRESPKQPSFTRSHRQTHTHTHTHTHTQHTDPVPNIYIRRGRIEWACGGIEGWGGELGHAVGRL